MHRILLLVRNAPCAGVRAREAVDAALLFSAFAPGLSVLFSGEGVWQLLPGQQADGPAGTPVAAMLGAFADYEIEQVYADAGALAERGLADSALLAGATALDDAGIRALFARHDRVVTI